MDKQVTYFYEPEATSHYFAPGHPMVPVRVNMTHELVQSYNLFSCMEISRFNQASVEELKTIHLSDYIDYLKTISPSTVNPIVSRFDDDCPVFERLFDYTSSVVGGSLAAAAKINDGSSDICINWAGGMHHAKRKGPSGFCYTNDIVACIVELLRHHKRVIYIDIDVHHGDGVEEFFYDSNRVMTVSFHQYGDFFPNTGATKECGVGQGKNYAINVPLKPFIDDGAYVGLFTKVIEKAMERYQPEALVMQMGADSIAGDLLGELNLSSEGHSQCLQYALSFNLPSVVLGGGGYSVYNVARTWTLETGAILGKTLDNNLPPNSYLCLSNQHDHLRIPSEKLKSKNSTMYLNRTLTSVLNILNKIEFVPSVPIQEVPRDWIDRSHSVDADDVNPDIRMSQNLRDKSKVHPLEYYRDDKDHDGNTDPESKSKLNSTDGLSASSLLGPVSRSVDDGIITTSVEIPAVYQ